MRLFVWFNTGRTERDAHRRTWSGRLFCLLLTTKVFVFLTSPFLLFFLFLRLSRRDVCCRCTVCGVSPGSSRSVAFLQIRGLFVFPLIENTLSGVRLSGSLWPLVRVLWGSNPPLPSEGGDPRATRPNLANKHPAVLSYCSSNTLMWNMAYLQWRLGSVRNLCSPKLHLFDQNYSKISKIVKCFYYFK